MEFKIKDKKRKRKVDLSTFKIEIRYIQDTHEEEVERFKKLLQLIFPHLSSVKDQGLDNFLVKVTVTFCNATHNLVRKRIGFLVRIKTIRVFSS